jgi:hypothetical protein
MTSRSPIADYDRALLAESQGTAERRSPIPALWAISRASTEVKAPTESTPPPTKTRRVERLSDEQIRELVAAYQQVQ